MRSTTHKLLAIYDSLPSLLAIAKEHAEQTGGYVYDIQHELWVEYSNAGKPFRQSMPYRSLFECHICGYMNTEVQHSLVNPGMKEINSSLYAVDILEGEIHEIREHGAAFSAESRKFLSQFDPLSD